MANTQTIVPVPKLEQITIKPVLVDRHPARVYLARLAQGSRRTMSQALDTIADMVTTGRCDADTMNWARLRYQHTAAIRARLAEQYAPATANKMLSALRGVLQECWRLGYISAEEYHRAVDLKAIRGSTLPRGRALSTGEIRALFEICENTPLGRRNAALLTLLYGAGLRRSEMVNLDLEDYKSDQGAITIRSGKGRKDRIAYIGQGGRDAMDDWLEVRGSHPGPLLHPINKSGRVIPGRLKPQSLYDICGAMAKAAGVPRFSPHDLRRTFISTLLDAGADIASVQRLAGHANIQTTTRYDRRGEETKRKTAELLHIPYRKLGLNR